MSTSRLLRVGIAGYGVVGQRRRRFIDQHENLQTWAVSDIKLEDGVSGDGVRTYSDYRKLLEEDLDMLFVSLPNYLAPEVSIAGLDRGMHVFCEKPLGVDAGEVERMAAACAGGRGLRFEGLGVNCPPCLV